MKNARMVLIAISLMILYSQCMYAQGPDTLWTRTYGGPNDDQAYSVQQTFDGGYIIAGYTKSFGAGDADVYLVRTNAIGDTLWTRTYGDILFDVGYCVQQTADSGFVVAGVKTLPGPDRYVYLIKTDENGDSLWTKIYSWYGEPIEARAYSVQQTLDGSYIIAGYIMTNSLDIQVLLIRTDEDGNTLWHKEYGDNSSNIAYSVQQTIDGGYVIVGTYSVKTDSLGDTLWTRPYGGYSVDQTTDGGYAITGHKQTSYFWDVSLIRADSIGDSLWSRVYGDDGYNDEGYSVQYTMDGGFIIAGNTNWVFDATCQLNGPGDAILVKANSFGDSLWSCVFGDEGDDRARSVEQTSDSGFIVAGYTDSYGVGNYDFWLIRTGADVGIEEEQNRRPVIRGVGLAAQPNPFTHYTLIMLSGIGLSVEEIELSIFDLSGRLIRCLRIDDIREGVLLWDGRDGAGIRVPGGIYLIRLKVGNLTSMHKVVFLR